MKVVSKSNDSLHNPYWKYQLGTSSYEVNDTPRRVEVIKRRLQQDSGYRFVAPNHSQNN